MYNWTPVVTMRCDGFYCVPHSVVYTSYDLDDLLLIIIQDNSY